MSTVGPYRPVSLVAALAVSLAPSRVAAVPEHSASEAFAAGADTLRSTIAVSAGCAGSTAVGGSSVTSGALVDDCEALLASEATLVGTGTTLNWDTATAIADWDGVALVASRVDTLELSNHGLAGSIPGELGSLSALRRLGLISNSLQGPIPAELGNLSSLEVLHLSSNPLKGPIPPELITIDVSVANEQVRVQ